MEKIKDIFSKIINTNVGKCALGLIVINLLLGIYDLFKISRYIGVSFLVGGCVVFLLLIGLLLFCSMKYKKTSVFLNLLLVIVLLIGCVMLHRTSDFTNTITNTTEYEVVDIVVLKESELTVDSDLNNKVMGAFLDDELGLKRAREILDENKKTGVRERLYDHMLEAYQDLLNGKIDMLVFSDDSISYLEEEVDYEDTVRSLFTKSYEIVSNYVIKDVNVLKEPFTVYLCGTDNSGSKDISSASRSDSNMLLSVNPNTKKISLQIIPRDLYSYVEHKNGSTKLSWSGRYGGVTTSMKAIEHELGIQINYYAKINWQGVKDLVNSLGGIDVYSHYTYSVGTANLKKGMNHLNGEQALLMCMERKSLPNNEISRGLQQMEVLKGMINKIIGEASFDNLMKVFHTIENNFMTNYPEDKFIDAFQLMISMRSQLADIDSYTMKGEYKWKYDDFKKNYYAYYFYPSEEEIAKVRDRINDVILGR